MKLSTSSGKVYRISNIISFIGVIDLNDIEETKVALKSVVKLSFFRMILKYKHTRVKFCNALILTNFR
jgi:hypothetical protein